MKKVVARARARERVELARPRGATSIITDKMRLLLLFLCLTTSTALRLPNAATRRGVIASATACTLPLFAGDAVWAYGIQARPAPDFSSIPKADESVIDPTFAAAARSREANAEAKQAQEKTARFGASAEPPQNKAQEKLAKAREEAQARALARQR